MNSSSLEHIKRKYVPGVGYCRNSHQENMCKIARELYYEHGIRKYTQIARILGYRHNKTINLIRKYVRSGQSCKKCTDRKNHYNY